MTRIADSHTRVSPERCGRCPCPRLCLVRCWNGLTTSRNSNAPSGLSRSSARKRAIPGSLLCAKCRRTKFSPALCPISARRSPLDIIEKALGKAVKRGTLSFVVTGSGRKRQPVFGLNTESDRAALAKLANKPPQDMPTEYEPLGAPVERPNIFEMYEQNIGLLSPIISDQLREAEAMYHEDWIADAFNEAVANNKRSWRYISAILERWEREGRGYGEPGRHLKKVTGF